MHFYTLTGEARHTQPTKKGAKNLTRPTGIADAKIQRLLPSNTEILKQAYNPILERWKLNTLAEHCYRCPPIYDESAESYVANVTEKAFEEVEQAADLGTRIHAAIESRFVRPDDPIEAELIGYVDNVQDVIRRLGITPVEHEVITVNPEEGYAGTTDMAWTKGLACGILDFKSRKTKPGRVVEPYQSEIAQIAAYHMSYWTKNGEIKDEHKGYNVYISTTEPGRIEVCEYDAEQLRKGWEWFQACAALFRIRHNWDPRTFVG